MYMRVCVCDSMSSSMFGLLFALNTFIALAIQTLVQVIVGNNILAWDTRHKYRFFSGQLGFVCVLFGVIHIYTHFHRTSVQVPLTSMIEDAHERIEHSDSDMNTHSQADRQ